MEASIWDINFLLGELVNIGLILLFFGAVVFFLRYLYGPGGKFRDPQWDVWNAEARRVEEEAKNAVLHQAANRVAGAYTGGHDGAGASRLDAPGAAVRGTPGPEAAACGAAPCAGRVVIRFPAPAGVEQELVDTFFAYSGGFVAEDPQVNRHLALKEEHTGKVLAHAAVLAHEEGVFADPVASRALLLAALFHDVGRFPQFARYRTFSDAHSCNHGTLGAKVIREQGFITAEPREVQGLALAAVAAHNRVSVPSAVAGRLRPVLLAVRDADKLDILRVMEDNLAPKMSPDSAVLLFLKDEPASYSPAVLAALVAGRVALYRDMRYFNDFRILLVSWLYDLRFASSFRIVRAEGRLERIVEGLEGAPEVREQVRAVLARQLGGV